MVLHVVLEVVQQLHLLLEVTWVRGQSEVVLSTVIVDEMNVTEKKNTFVQIYGLTCDSVVK